MSQSIREVYRKLAGALHPDRESDPQERERKTALMQRVNQAYAKNNLLQLLDCWNLNTSTRARSTKSAKTG